MARPELGTKRLCTACGAKYYDLHRDPIICPKCGEMFKLNAADKAAKAIKAVQKDEEDEVLVKDDVELVSLEDADEEAGEDIPDLDDDNIESDIGGDDDDVFLDDEDEDDDAVPGIVVSRDDDEV